MIIKTPTLKSQQTCLVLAISALAFVSFYFNAYFSPDYKGMLGYEAKDTLIQLNAYFRAADNNATLFWDPYYYYYTPKFPQAPLSSPITVFILLLHKIFNFSPIKSFLPCYLAVLAIIQILCVYTMYLFLRSRGINFMGSVLGGLCYGYNYQTFVFGIKHGYERISALMVIPLCLIFFFRVLDGSSRKSDYRRRVALAALFFGIALVCNGDVKPTFFFGIFLLLAAALKKPFSFNNIAAAVWIIFLGGMIFLVQGLPTLYAYRDSVRGMESLESVMDFSLRPVNLLLTHISTSFTDRPDYPWESTAEFSMSFMVLVLFGLFTLRRYKLKRILWGTLIFSYLWIMGQYTPLSPLIGSLMRLTGMHHPARMTILLYFCYGFILAVGVTYLSNDRYDKLVVVGLSLFPLTLLIIFWTGYGNVPLQYMVFAFVSYLILLGVVFSVVPRKMLWLIALCFMLEKTTVLSSLRESNRGDPTEYYGYDEIYRSHRRVQAIRRDFGYRGYRAFFAEKDLPDLFSHNYYLNAFTDNIRPIFAYMWNEEWPRRYRDMQVVCFQNWGSPMWDLLNVKYLVDLEKYFASWDEQDTSKKGLEHLEVVDEHVKINPDVEKEVFVRYRAERTDDASFLNGLASGRLDVKEIAYLNDAGSDSLVIAPAGLADGQEEISIIERRTDEIAIDVTVPREALVVFSEFWYFPWSVEVDGHKAHLCRVYNILQGVRIPSGSHRVRFYFNSRHWKLILPFIVSYGLMAILISYAGINYCRMRFGASSGKRPK